MHVETYTSHHQITNLFLFYHYPKAVLTLVPAKNCNHTKCTWEHCELKNDVNRKVPVHELQHKIFKLS